MMREKLVIFDYSGTLSLDAVSFGEDDNLIGELERSGLADLGVESPGTFWGEIVNPAWKEGSTTSIGYAELIFRRIRENSPPAVSDTTIRLSARRFVDSYLRHSPIDSRWSSILQKLSGEASAVTIIATDHYAEATAYIVRYLDKMGVRAVPLKNAPDVSPSSFVVANSADLGVYKADQGFWEGVKSVLRLDAIRSTLIIDDFGFNEGAGDSYANRQKVKDRTSKTIGLLERLFDSPVYAITFILERDNQVGRSGKDEKTCGDLISWASAEIERWLQ